MKKIICFILSAVLIVGSLTACENKDNPQTDTDTHTDTEYVQTDIEIPQSSDTVALADLKQENRLSNPNATKEAIALYNYIIDVYGNNIISAQQESTWKGSDDYEMDFIFDATGKYPAMRGLDFMNNDFYGVVDRATEWWNKGGIVTICWHCGSDFNDSWDECQADDFDDWDRVLTEGTPEYEDLIRGMDKAATALKSLQKKGIPVLWRPFHEFDGAWFWWGKGWSERFIKLWRIMYDRYTNHHGLNNLIWVLGYSGRGESYGEWYPGDEYCDVVGADSYDGGACGNLFRKVKAVVGDRKPICFHECGTNPTVNELKNAGANWCWFMTWHTSYLTRKNDKDALFSLYNSDYVITLDELPKIAQSQKDK